MRAERVGKRALELGALAEKLQEGMPGEALRAGAEQAFRRRIRVSDNELAIERDDRRGKQLEAREWQRVP